MADVIEKPLLRIRKPDVADRYLKIRYFISYIRYIQEQDEDVLIVMSGRKGSGKSSLWLLITLLYLNKFGLECKDCHKKWVYTGKTKGKEPPYQEPCPYCKSQNVMKMSGFNLERYCAFGNDEVTERIKNLPAFSPLPCDEGVRFAMGEDWNVRENKDLKKLVAQCRPKHLILMICIPKLTWLDKKYRNDMVTFWVRIIVKGLALIEEPDLGETDDPFMLEDFQKMLGSYFHRSSHDDLIRKCKLLVNRHAPTFDYLSIPKPPHKLYKQYLKLRTRKVFNDDDKEEVVDKKDMAKFMIYNLVTNWDRILKEVSENKVKRPTFKLIRELLLLNPLNNEYAVSQEALQKYFRQVESEVKKKPTGVLNTKFKKRKV